MQPELHALQMALILLTAFAVLTDRGNTRTVQPREQGCTQEKGDAVATQAPTLETYEEAALRLRMSKRKLQYMLARGVFGKTRQGRESCVFADEIDAYLEGLAKGNGEAAVKAFRQNKGRIKR